MASPETATPAPSVQGFWAWLVERDRDGDRGISNIVNRWLFFHVLLGLALAVLCPSDAATIAKTIAIPGAAILIGLAFGWAGRSANLLQDKSFSRFLIENGPSPEGYVYAFQLAVLAVLIFIATALFLAVGSTGASLGSAEIDAFANRTLLFTVGSIAVRESWGIIYFVNKLTIQYYRVREEELRKEREG